MSFLERTLAVLVAVATIVPSPALAVQQPAPSPTEPGEQGEQDNQAFTTARGFAEYRIGPGDELLIRIWTGVDAKEYEVFVQADGNIFLPFVGLANLEAGDRSALELRDQIVDRLRVSYREPAAEVHVKTRVARVVTLLGEIRATTRARTGPGRYPLPGRIRLVDFVTEHGGFSNQANLNLTQLIRKGQTTVYNLSRAIFESDDSQNPVLDDQDLVYVPPLSTSSLKLMMFGEVGRQGLLEMADEVPIAEAIARSGGLTKNAHKSGVVVVRGGIENPTVLKSDFEALNKGDVAQNFLLKDGDMVFVGRRKLATFTDVMLAFSVPLSAIYTTVLITQATSK
jgi:polysaccharide export outer membrane protein